MKFNRGVISIIILNILLLLSSCNREGGIFDDREFLDNIYVDVPETDYQLLIKEWRWLLGSGEEIYLIDKTKEDEEAVYLGKCTGGDDGYCPFNDGKYTVTYSDGKIEISWLFNQGGEESKEAWRSKTFDIP